MKTQHHPALHYSSFQVMVHETPVFRELKLERMSVVSKVEKKKGGGVCKSKSG